MQRKTAPPCLSPFRSRGQVEVVRVAGAAECKHLVSIPRRLSPSHTSPARRPIAPHLGCIDQPHSRAPRRPMRTPLRSMRSQSIADPVVQPSCSSSMRMRSIVATFNRRALALSHRPSALGGWSRKACGSGVASDSYRVGPPGTAEASQPRSRRTPFQRQQGSDCSPGPNGWREP